MKRALVVACVAVSALAGSCTKVGSDPAVVVAIAFDSLPYPAIVAGDTLRDENGVAKALTASALNSDGDVVSDASITFLMLDAGGTISPDGFAVSTDGAITSLRALAQVGSLQSRPLTLIVTARPDSIADGVVPVHEWVLTTPSTHITGPISVKVLSNTVTPPVPVNGWIVRFSIEYHGAALSPTDATLAWLVDDNDRRSAGDTTAADGSASRRLHLGPAALAVAEPDSFVVIATATARGVPLSRSPLRILVRVKPLGL